MLARITTTTLLVALVAASCTSSGTPAPSVSAPKPVSEPSASVGAGPTVDPSNFVRTVDNPYFPLRPGARYTYTGIKDGERQRDEVVVTTETKTILGVPCVVVHDTATHAGKLLEQTSDWYAQDREGNVWYFGEDTKEFDDQGKVTSTEGSWESGVDGAQPGIVMPAHPQVTDSSRQEFYKGHAEDMFWIVSLDQRVAVPYGRFANAILTLEWTPLDPNVIDKKFYVAGVGLVAEESAAGPAERAELADLIKP